MELSGTDPYTWRRLIRRVRLGSTTKLVASMLADYSGPDGRNVRPGNERLAAVTELSEKSVRNALAKLRDMGLVERVFEGSKAGRKGLADEYRLTYPASLEASSEMLPPDERAGSPVAGTGGQPESAEPHTSDPPSGSGGAEPEHRNLTPGTPVTDARNTGTTYRPPNQAPNQAPTNKNPGGRSAGAEVEGAGRAREPANDDHDPQPDDYRAAYAVLEKLPDYGQQFMALAAERFPDTDMRQRVIHAARMAKEGIPA